MPVNDRLRAERLDAGGRDDEFNGTECEATSPACAGSLVKFGQILERRSCKCLT